MSQSLVNQSLTPLITGANKIIHWKVAIIFPRKVYSKHARGQSTIIKTKMTARSASGGATFKRMM
jgi:hypothetical protein